MNVAVNEMKSLSEMKKALKNLEKERDMIGENIKILKLKIAEHKYKDKYPVGCFFEYKGKKFKVTGYGGKYDLEVAARMVKKDGTLDKRERFFSDYQLEKAEVCERGE